MSVLDDSFGRRFSYLRLSLTDVCNFRCQYCLPNGYQKPFYKEEPPLDVKEILRLVRGFSELGIWKVRLTGGEPTVRKDFFEIAEEISKIPKIKKLALTTNAYKLQNICERLMEVGVSNLNVSLDSLDRKRFERVTGRDMLDNVLLGIDKALSLGFSRVKINCVLLSDIKDEEIDGFINLARSKSLSIRFIELMRTGNNAEYFEQHHLSASILRNKLLSSGWVALARSEGAGPAEEYSHEDCRGSVGLIAPYSKDFCINCNRLRVSCRGELKLCLFGDGGYSLRHLLQSDSQIEELKETIQGCVLGKEVSHYLHVGRTGSTQNLSVIGG